MKAISFELISQHPPAECALRLHHAMETRGVTASGVMLGVPYRVKSVVGRASESLVCLHNNVGDDDSLQVLFNATMRPHGEGTLIIGGCGISPFATWIVRGWFGFCMPLSSFIFISALLHPGATNRQFGIVLPPCLLLFGLLVVGFTRNRARGIARSLIEFVTDALQASAKIAIPGRSNR